VPVPVQLHVNRTTTTDWAVGICISMSSQGIDYATRAEVAKVLVKALQSGNTRECL